MNYCYSTNWCQLLTRDYKDGECDIMSLRTNPHKRRQGHAKTVMAQVLADADAEGVTLLLTARAGRGGMTQEELEAWYERLGFVTVARDGHGNARMERSPATL